MEQIRATDFIEGAKSSDDFEIQQKGKAVEAAQTQTSDQIWVVLDGAPESAIAFVEGNAKREMFLNFNYLDSIQTAKHAAQHEANHNKVKFWEIPTLDRFSSDHDRVINKAIGLAAVADSIALMEGFNEDLTINQVGIDPKVAYLYKEVPAARQLEKLCNEITGASLTEAYAQGNHKLFAERLQTLADKLLLIEATKEGGYSQAEQTLIRDEILASAVRVRNGAQAEKIVDAIYTEQAKEALMATLGLGKKGTASKLPLGSPSLHIQTNYR